MRIERRRSGRRGREGHLDGWQISKTAFNLSMIFLNHDSIYQMNPKSGEHQGCFITYQVKGSATSCKPDGATNKHR